MYAIRSYYAGRAQIRVPGAAGLNVLRMTIGISSETAGAMVTDQEKEQTFFVLEGTGSVKVGEETQTIRAGDLVFVPTVEYLRSGLPETSSRIQIA